MSTQQKLLSIVAMIALAAVLLVTFRAYLSPAMVFDFASLHICS